MTGAPALRVLLTRPRRDSEETARLLSSHNIASVIAPLIEIGDIAGATLDLAGVQAMLVTSANGARALARAMAHRDIPVFAVGDASAAAAREKGFSRVTSADGDVVALATLVRNKLAPENGALLHAAGSAVAGDLAGELGAHGFVVHRCQIYRAQAVDALPETARRALKEDMIDTALFYSPRTAALFVQLVVAAGLVPKCRRIVAGCLSPAVAEAAAALPFAEIRTAETPDQASLLSAVIGS